MQVTEVEADGLKRRLKVVLPAADIDSEVNSRLQILSRDARIPGFRPGKVPVSLLRQRFGAAVRGEALEALIQSSLTQALAERSLRPAMQPTVEITTPAEGAAAGDIEYLLALEVLPEIAPMDFSTLSLTRLRAEITDEAVDEQVARIAHQRRIPEAVEPARPLAAGDNALLDYDGRVAGKKFAGGSAQDKAIEIGPDGFFVPGFVDQLIGMNAGETRDVTATLPENYAGENHDVPGLAGREAVFTVTLKAVRTLAEPVIDDALAEKVGFDDLADMKAFVRTRLEREAAEQSRARLKRVLLDRLAESYSFTIPDAMMEAEFGAIWQQVEGMRARAAKIATEAADKFVAESGVDASFEVTVAEIPAKDAGGEVSGLAEKEPESKALEAITQGDATLKTEYRAIAERRVRLGLVLGEVGRLNNIEISTEEMRAAAVREMQRYPGQERAILDFYARQPAALATLKSSLMEEKAVDFILEMATIEEKLVTREALFADEDDEAAADESAA